MFERIAELVDAVPEFDRFAGVDELVEAIREIARRHPDLAEMHRIGTSRDGEPLWSLTIRGGDRQVLVVGGVHPNEPIGGVSALHLARTLVADDELRREWGCTWHIVACIDPDGTRLNEPWFEPPLTMAKYGRSFYRPAADEQVEWSFPFAYKDTVFDRVMPETEALMRLIDETRPMLLCSLHNGEYGGVFHYLSDTSPRLNEQLTSIPDRLGLPLHTGEGEAPFIEQLAPAIFRAFTAEQEYDYLEGLGIDPAERAGGESSHAYASRYGTAYLATEVPYWANADADDHTRLAVSYSDLLGERAELTHETARVLTAAFDAVRPAFQVRSPQLRAMECFLPFLRIAAEADRVRAGQEDALRPAVVAERFMVTATTHSTRVRFAGMLLSALGSEIARGNDAEVLRVEHARLTRVFDRWAAEADADVPPRPIPIRKLVGVQCGAMLATAADLLDR
ncbi:M14 family zinc carboxypeptidase [Parasphingorhabdus pacifica]